MHGHGQALLPQVNVVEECGAHGNVLLYGEHWKYICCGRSLW